MESTWRSAHNGFVGDESFAGSVRSTPMPTGAEHDDQQAHPPSRDLDDTVRLVDGPDLSMWVDRRVRSSDGDSLGITVGVYAHAGSRHPVWLIVDTGTPGTSAAVAPAHGSSLLGDDIVIGPDRDAVLNAPTVNGLNVMDPADERSLIAHYARRACLVVDPSRRRMS